MKTPAQIFQDRMSDADKAQNPERSERKVRQVITIENMELINNKLIEKK